MTEKSEQQKVLDLINQFSGDHKYMLRDDLPTEVKRAVADVLKPYYDSKDIILAALNHYFDLLHRADPNAGGNGLGKQALHGWFGLSYSSFAILSRAMMMQMPDDWCGLMARLLEQIQQEFPNCHPNFTVRALDDNGKMIPMPEYLVRYRHPLYDEIDKCRSFKQTGADLSQAGG